MFFYPWIQVYIERLLRQNQQQREEHQLMRAKLFFLSFLVVSPSYADLPLTVENLLSDKGKSRFEFSVNYVNSERRGIGLADPISIQTSDATFINIPATIGENSTNTDVLVFSTGVRYGLTAKDEIYGRASGLVVDSRSESVTGETFKDSDTRLSDVWIGINHKFRDDVDKPALFAFGEVQIAENQSDGSTEYGKSFLVGLTTYQTYDPIVLSLTGSYQHNLKTGDNGNSYKQGNSISLSPSVGFAVNDKVTLTGGVNWRMQQASEYDGKTEGIRRTTTSLNLGLGYALGKDNTLNFSVRPQVSGDGDVQLGMNWIHRF